MAKTVIKKTVLIKKTNGAQILNRWGKWNGYLPSNRGLPSFL